LPAPVLAPACLSAVAPVLSAAFDGTPSISPFVTSGIAHPAILAAPRGGIFNRLEYEQQVMLPAASDGGERRPNQRQRGGL
jgi:hypothetical protein